MGRVRFSLNQRWLQLKIDEDTFALSPKDKPRLASEFQTRPPPMLYGGPGCNPEAGRERVTWDWKSRGKPIAAKQASGSPAHVGLELSARNQPFQPGSGSGSGSAQRLERQSSSITGRRSPEGCSGAGFSTPPPREETPPGGTPGWPPSLSARMQPSWTPGARSSDPASTRSPEEAAQEPASCQPVCHASPASDWSELRGRPRPPRGWTGRGGGAAVTPPPSARGGARPAVSYRGRPGRRASAPPPLARARTVSPPVEKVRAAAAASPAASPPALVPARRPAGPPVVS